MDIILNVSPKDYNLVSGLGAKRDKKKRWIISNATNIDEINKFIKWVPKNIKICHDGESNNIKISFEKKKKKKAISENINRETEIRIAHKAASLRFIK